MEIVIGLVIFAAIVFFIVNKKKKDKKKRGPIGTAPAGQDPTQAEIDAAERGEGPNAGNDTPS
jgi:hypothetical protein